MSARFRHLDYAATAAVRDLGPAAVDDLLERGDLGAWQPLAREIAGDPWGAVAETVLRICSAHRMYGTSRLWPEWIERLRHATGAEEGTTLAGARVRAGLTQSEVARRLGISQADVSKLERRSDVRLSTLAAYARALGATLRITLIWDGADDPTRLDVGSQAERRGRAGSLGGPGESRPGR